MGKIKSYTKQILAQLTGDTSKVIAERNYRKGQSAVKGQVAALDSKVVDLEAALEDAQEKFEKAFAPSTAIEDSKAYISNVAYYQNQLDKAQESLDSNQESLDYWKAILAKFDEETEE